MRKSVRLLRSYSWSLKIWLLRYHSRSVPFNFRVTCIVPSCNMAVIGNGFAELFRGAGVATWDVCCDRATMGTVACNDTVATVLPDELTLGTGVLSDSRGMTSDTVGRWFTTDEMIGGAESHWAPQPLSVCSYAPYLSSPSLTGI